MACSALGFPMCRWISFLLLRNWYLLIGWFEDMGLHPSSSWWLLFISLRECPGPSCSSFTWCSVCESPVLCRTLGIEERRLCFFRVVYCWATSIGDYTMWWRLFSPFPSSWLGCSPSKCVLSGMVSICTSMQGMFSLSVFHSSPIGSLRYPYIWKLSSSPLLIVPTPVTGNIVAAACFRTLILRPFHLPARWAPQPMLDFSFVILMSFYMAGFDSRVMYAEKLYMSR